MSLQQDAIPNAVETSGHARKRSPVAGLLSLFGAIVVVGSFVALTSALAIADVWVGFLFALYWGGIEHADFRKLPHCAVGAALGLTVAYGLHALPQVMGTAAWGPCIAAIVLLVYFQIMGWFTVAINMVTMLFLTVATIPMIQAGTQYPKLMISLAFGALYFACVIWLARQISSRGNRNRAMQRQA
jgi:hypothetical protein